MTADRHRPSLGDKTTAVNPGYAQGQIAKAFKTSQEHGDPETRERALAKIAKWESVLLSMLAGDNKIGSRSPVNGIPPWVTLEVLHGGFATGKLLAGGELREHERHLLKQIPYVEQGEERLALNGYYLSDAGLEELKERIRSGCYNISVPEEGALLVVAWMVEHDRAQEARQLLEILSPFFAQLRFYPEPSPRARRFGAAVHVQNVSETIVSMRRIKPNRHILAQKEAVDLWLPLYDRIVALFLETKENDRPCQQFPNDWFGRASGLLNDYKTLREEHNFSSKLTRAGSHSALLLQLLEQSVAQNGALSEREIGRVRHILGCYVAKRGAPDSARCQVSRRRQAADVEAPTHHAIAMLLASRLEQYPPDEGIDDTRSLQVPVSAEEGERTGLPPATVLPSPIQRKLARCLNATTQELIDRGLIGSSEALAKVLPQMTAGVRAMGIDDPALRQLYSAIYNAFRRRRSLLLLNLAKQVQIEELPWIAAIEQFRSDHLSSQQLAGQTFTELCVLTLTSFPHTVLPNKLLQELRALAASAQLDLPLIEELATDIFMGKFSGKYSKSIRQAAELLEDSLYATYYGIDYADLRSQLKPNKWRKTGKLAQHCAARAGVPLGSFSPATNGMIIEQQQILSTQNLASIFLALGSNLISDDELLDMCQRSFSWICQRLQVRVDTHHAELLVLKNSAYAWRQMLFFLSLLPAEQIAGFLTWSQEFLDLQEKQFSNRFQPALTGLTLAAEGIAPGNADTRRSDARQFLGWSDSRHWLAGDLG